MTNDCKFPATGRSRSASVQDQPRISPRARWALKGFSTPRSIHPLDVTADRAGLGRRWRGGAASLTP